MRERTGDDALDVVRSDFGNLVAFLQEKHSQNELSFHYPIHYDNVAAFLQHL